MNDQTQPTTSNTETPKRRGYSWWRLTVGALIVACGGALLAHALGWQWSIPFDVLRFWPVLIILFGLSILVRGRYSGLFGALLTLCVAGYVGLAVVQLTGQPKQVSTTELRVERIAEAQSAHLALHLGAIALSVNGGATDMLNGTYRSNIGTVNGTSALTDGVHELSYSNTASIRSGWTGGMRNELNVRLNNDVPLALNIDTGASSINAELSDLLVSHATIASGASSITVNMGDRMDTASLTIKAGASSIDVTLPSTVGVNAHIDSGLSSRDIPKFHERSKGEYESDNLSTTTKRLDLRIEAGVSSIAIHWK